MNNERICISSKEFKSYREAVRFAQTMCGHVDGPIYDYDGGKHYVVTWYGKTMNWNKK